MFRYKNRVRIYFFLAIFSILLIYIYFSPYFQLQKIVIEENHFVNEQWIGEIIINQKTTNLFYISKHKMRKLIMSNIPQIRKIKFHKNYLSHTLNVRVWERKPFVNIVAYPDNFLVEENGIILNIDKDKKPLPFPEYSNLPIIVGLTEESLLGRTELSAFYSYLFKGPLATLIKEFDKTGITFDINDPWAIKVLSKELVQLKIGDPNNISDKLKVIKSILKNLESNDKEKVEYIDVSQPKYPVVKLI